MNQSITYKGDGRQPRAVTHPTIFPCPFVFAFFTGTWFNIKHAYMMCPITLSHLEGTQFKTKHAWRSNSLWPVRHLGDLWRTTSTFTPHRFAPLYFKALSERIAPFLRSEHTSSPRFFCISMRDLNALHHPVPFVICTFKHSWTSSTVCLVAKLMHRQTHLHVERCLSSS